MLGAWSVASSSEDAEDLFFSLLNSSSLARPFAAAAARAPAAGAMRGPRSLDSKYQRQKPTHPEAAPLVPRSQNATWMSSKRFASSCTRDRHRPTLQAWTEMK